MFNRSNKNSTITATSTKSNGSIVQTTTTTIVQRQQQISSRSEIVRQTVETRQSTAKSPNVPKLLESDATPFKINTGYKSPYRQLGVTSVYQLNGSGGSGKAINEPNRTAWNRAKALSEPRSEPTHKPNGKVSEIGKMPQKDAAKFTPPISVPTYDTTGPNRGKVLIINNIKFPQDEERKGAEKDEKNLQSTFQQFRLSVETQRNLSAEKMRQAFRQFAAKKSLKQHNLCVVVVMSHGHALANHDQVTEVAGIGGGGIKVAEIVDIFSRSEHLRNKPKIFIFQCCRGTKQMFETDATPFVPYADVLIAHSTLPGFVSYRSPQTGSLFIQQLCSVFNQFGHALDVESMLKKVDEQLRQLGNGRQVSCYEGRGFKRCFLTPQM